MHACTHYCPISQADTDTVDFRLLVLTTEPTEQRKDKITVTNQMQAILKHHRVRQI